MMMSAELKCRKFKAGKVPYSPYLSNLGSKIILLRLIIKKKIQTEKKETIIKTIIIIYLVIEEGRIIKYGELK